MAMAWRTLLTVWVKVVYRKLEFLTLKVIYFQNFWPIKKILLVGLRWQPVMSMAMVLMILSVVPALAGDHGGGCVYLTRKSPVQR